MLEVIRNHFNVGPERMHHEIQQMLAKTKSVLSRKGIEYIKLKSALVPKPKRR